MSVQDFEVPWSVPSNGSATYFCFLVVCRFQPKYTGLDERHDFSVVCDNDIQLVYDLLTTKSGPTTLLFKGRISRKKHEMLFVFYPCHRYIKVYIYLHVLPQYRTGHHVHKDVSITIRTVPIKCQCSHCYQDSAHQVPVLPQQCSTSTSTPTALWLGKEIIFQSFMAGPGLQVQLV